MIWKREVPVMKSIQTKTAAAMLIFASSIIPAYGQARGHDHDSDRSDRREQRGQAGAQQPAPQSARPKFQNQPSPQEQDSGGGGFRYQQQDRRRYGGDDRFQQQHQEVRPAPQMQQAPPPEQNRRDRGWQNQQNRPDRYRRQFEETRPQIQSQQALPQLDRGIPSYGQHYGGPNQYQPQPERPQSDQQQFYRQQRGLQQQRRGFEQQYRPQNEYRGAGSFQQFSSHNWQNDHRRWSQRGGYHGYRIPQTRFYSSFGRQHYFRIGGPEFYAGYPRFEYAGYSFRIVDPWPDYWAQDWYEFDDVYIDYENDGYYLYNTRYPGVGISVDIEF
jgi:hypothetical protein